MKRIISLIGLYAQMALAVVLAPVARYFERNLLFTALPQQWPDIQQWAQHLGFNPNAIELIEQPLYDFALYPTAGSTSIKFFSTGRGAGLSTAPGNAGNVKTLVDTNLQGVGGQLPSPQAFWVAGIEVVCDPGSSAAANTFALKTPGTASADPTTLPNGGDADVNAILSTGSLTFNVSEKPYYQDAPLYMFPPSATLALDSSVSTFDTNTAVAGVLAYAKLRSVGRIRTLNPGVGLATAQNFDVTLTWPALVATPSGFNARIGVRLLGFQMRAAQ